MPDHRLVVVEEERRQRLGQLGLADAGRPQEQERPERPVRVVQPRPRPPDRVRHRLHRLALADDPAPELLLHAQELLALALEHPVDRDAGPALDHRRHLLRRDRLLDHHVLAGALGLLQPLLELRDDAVGELARPLQVPLPLDVLELHPRLVELLLQLRRALQLVPLRPPARRHLRRALLERAELLHQPRQPVLARRVASRASAPPPRSASAGSRGRARRAPRASNPPPCAAGSPPRPSGRSPCPAGTGR